MVTAAGVAVPDHELAVFAPVPERLRLEVGSRQVEPDARQGRTATASPRIFVSPCSLTTAQSSTTSCPARFSRTVTCVVNTSPGHVWRVKRTRYERRLPAPT